MTVPQAADYNEAVQNPRQCFCDPDLCNGVPVVSQLGLPMPWSGNFADVYKIECPTKGHTFAVKCFTREVPHLAARYREISACVQQVDLPFLVEFTHLDRGILIRGDWYPVIKMRWVNGSTLNDWVRDSLAKPWRLQTLAQAWLLLARSLRESHIAHGDLQHGNVLLVPGHQSSRLHLKLVDYDGLFVPGLAERKPGENGHPAYQHPERMRSGIYSPEIDRFSHLVIYCGLHCLLAKGRKLWDDYDNGDNFLFREQDFTEPGSSPLFHELWHLEDGFCRTLVGRLILACQSSFDKVPLLDDVADPSFSPWLTNHEVTRVRDILSSGVARIQRAPAEVKSPFIEIDLGLPPQRSKIPRASTGARPPAGLLQSLRNRVRRLRTAVPAGVGGGGRPLVVSLSTVLSIALVLMNVVLWWRQLRTPGEPVAIPPAPASFQSSNDRADRQAPPVTLVDAQTSADTQKRPMDVESRTGGTTVGRGSIRATVVNVTGTAPPTATSSSDTDAFLARQREPSLTVSSRDSRCVDYSPHNDCFATAGASLKLWNPIDGQAIRKFAGHSGDVLAVAFSHDGNRIASGGRDCTAKIWYAAGNRIASFRDTSAISAVAFSPDGAWLAAGGGHKLIKLWNTSATHKAKPRVLSGHTGRVTSLAFSPSGEWIASGSRDKTLRLWETERGRSNVTLEGHTETVNSVAFSSDGQWVASGSDDKTLKLWIARPGHPIPKTFCEHTGPVTSVAFTADGKWLVTGSSDGTVKIWSPAGGAAVRTLTAHAGPITGIAISRDCKRLVGVGATLIAIWDLSERQLETVRPNTSKPRGPAFSVLHGI